MNKFLQRLRINKFRKLKPATEITFNHRHNVLLGQNGTGKTTLLDIVSAILRSDFSKFNKEEFDFEYSLGNENLKIQISVNNARQSLLNEPSIEAIVDNKAIKHSALGFSDRLERSLFSAKAEIDFGDEISNLLISVSGSKVTVREQRNEDKEIQFDAIEPTDTSVWINIIRGLSKWNSEKYKPQPSPARFFSLVLPELEAIRFDESLEYFEAMRKTSIYLVRTNSGSVSAGSSPDSPKLVEAAKTAAQADWAKDRYALNSDEIDFFNTTAEILGFKSGEASIEIEQSSKSEDNEETKIGNLRFSFSHRAGWKIAERRMSYGQKRVFAFMYYLSCNSNFAVADELVNGLHHNWIQACMSELGQRQAFLTSQNPLLLDHLTFDSPDDVRSRFVLCRWDESGEQMTWENMSPEAAADFFSSYEVGFQQVGELLQSKGLW